MRTIKFRIWNGMEMEYNITSGKFGTFFVHPEKGDGLNPKDTASLTENTTKYSEGTPVMQFTGLTDKNGKEIFEGDVVSHEYETEYGPCEHRDVVEYSGGAFYPICEKPENEFEVIGNIYENPKFLKS